MSVNIFEKDKTIIGFGELLLSLTPDGYRRIIQSDRFNVFYTGAEANVLAGISSLGGKTGLVTRLPDNAVAFAAIAAMRRFGIGTEHILKGGDRIGVIYNERGFDARPSSVTYDRKNTSFSEIKPGDIDWKSIFADASWYHFGGTAPALGEKLPEAIEESVRTAKALGIPVSCDLNFRAKLWSHARAGEIMRRLINGISLLICGENDAVDIFGACKEGPLELGRNLYERFGVLRTAFTERKTITDGRCEWQAHLYDSVTDTIYSSELIKMRILNRIGGGDAFAAGLIYCLSNGMDLCYSVNFSAAFCRLKHSIEDDFALISHEEVDALLRGDEIRVKR